MKILFLAHRIPYPPNKGDKIRSYHALRALTERGHEVHLLTFADDPRDLGYQVDLAKLCASVTVLPLNRKVGQVKSLLALARWQQPLSVGFYAARQMRRAVAAKVAQVAFDAVFVFSSTMVQYVPPTLAARTVVDLVDIDSEKWRDYSQRIGFPMKQVYQLEAKRLRRYEHELISKYALTVLTTPREVALLTQVDEFTKRARVRTITNGVDLQFFKAEPWRLSVLDKMPPNERQWFADPTAPRIVFTGAMDYYANIEGVRFFAEAVLPLVRERVPRAEFLIVGSKPAPEVTALAQQHTGVTVTGFVEDVRPYLQLATVCVVPLRIARGIQNKVLEAMAASKALVVTNAVASGLGLTHEEQVLIADQPRHFADSVTRLIQQEALRNELGESARQFVETDHDWEPLLERFAELVEGVGLRHANNQTTESTITQRLIR